MCVSVIQGKKNQHFYKKYYNYCFYKFISTFNYFFYNKLNHLKSKRLVQIPRDKTIILIDSNTLKSIDNSNKLKSD